jgi:hypothetical protein
VKLFRRAPKAAGVAPAVVLALLGFACSGPPPQATAPPRADAPALEIPEEAPAIARVRSVKSAPMSLTASDGTGLRLGHLSAKTIVDEPLAYTELHLVFHNPEDRVLEGRFRITLPEGAAVSRFAMRIGEIWQEGEMLPKATARRTYEDFLHRRQDPALLEQGAGNEFSARVFPIPPRAPKELIIAYAQRIDGSHATLVPLSGLPAVDQVEIEMTRAGDDKPTVEISRAAFAPAADVALDPRLRSRGDGLRHGEIALLRARPWGEAAPDPLGPALVLVDSSASRALDLEKSIALVDRIVAAISDARGSATPVTVASFDQGTELIYEGTAGSFGPPDREKIAARHALGASDLEGVLAWASGYLAKKPRPRVVFVTDGVATAGDDEGKTIAVAAAALAGRGVERIDAVAVGGGRDTAMLAHLVTAGLPRHGVVIDGHAPPSEITARLSKATRPHLRIEVEGASWWYPRKVDGIQPGDEIAIFATLRDAASPRVRIDGKALPAPELKRADGRLLRQAWARARIDDLLEQERREGRSAASAEHVVALSMAHRILSPYTSLLVLETEDDYRRYGIDRTKLGDILTIAGGALATLDRAPPPAKAPAARPAPPTDADSTAPGLARQGALVRNPWGDDIGDSFGAGKLALSGVGEGGGGRGEGMDLGSVGTLGAGSGAATSPDAGTGTEQGFGSGGGALRSTPSPPRVRMGATRVSGRLPPEVVQRIVRQNFGRFRACYQQALLASPNLAGRVTIRFVIATNGSTKGATVLSSDLENAAMESCVAAAFEGLSFPMPEGGVVTVTYPLSFSPNGTEPPPTAMGRADVTSRGLRPSFKPDAKPVVAEYTGTFGSVMDHIRSGRSQAALAVASRWRAESPGDVLALLALGEALEAGRHEGFAARAYGSIIDMYPDRADLRRYAGARLERLDSVAAQHLARDSYAKARRDRPDHPSSHRLLAFAELRLGHHERAFDALAASFEQPYRTGSFPGVTQILREDLGLVGAAWIEREPDARERVLARLEKLGATLESSASMRVVMTWETDANDVDLHVYDSRGGHAFHGNRSLAGGGTLYADVTTGFGPECFTLRKGEGLPPAWSYELFVHYYRRGPMGYGMGKAQIVHHDGRGGLAFEERPFLVMADDAYVSLGTVAPRFE